MQERTFLNSTNDSVDPYEYRVLKCGGNIFSKMRIKKLHSSYEDDEDEEEEDNAVPDPSMIMKYHNG